MKNKKKYDTKEKQTKFVKGKGNILTFKKSFWWKGEQFTQILVTGFQKNHSGAVKVIGFGRDSEWYESMEELLAAIDWEQMEAWHALDGTDEAAGERFNPKGVLSEQQEIFINEIKRLLYEGKKHDKKLVEKLAAQHGITDRTEAKELTELAIVVTARDIARDLESPVESRYKKIVELYKKQVNLSHRTSQSMLLQQYSTPAPIGFLAGIFCGIDKFTPHEHTAFEPSAGNGLLTIAADPAVFFVNEIDQVRNRDLQAQGFSEVFRTDATQDFSKSISEKWVRVFDAVITNPPFGRLNQAIKFDGYPIDTLEHLMAARALETLADNGKAAIIVGGHTRYDKKGRIQEGPNRIFFNYLYNHFHVADVIPVYGKALYSRQGTSVDTRLILISGRKKTPEGAAPLQDKERDEPVKDFDTLYQRVMLAMKYNPGNVKEAEMKTEDEEFNLTNSIDPGLVEKVEKLKKKYPSAVILYRQLDFYLAIGEDAYTVSIETGTPFKNKLMNGRTVDVTGFPAFQLDYFMPKLVKRGYKVAIVDELTDPNKKVNNPASLEHELEEAMKALDQDLERLSNGQDLGAPYMPASQSCQVLNTVTPDSMDYETKQALEFIRKETGSDIDEFVRQRLKYLTKMELCKSLSAEQTDAVAMAIYNIEARGQGMIIGDQTGIGKGRIAAAMIRYAVLQGHKPVFITEKPNLFSDLYRDLIAIGSGHLVPFIVNGRESKTDIKDASGEILYQALPAPEQQNFIKEHRLPGGTDFVLATYSQFNSPEKKPEKPAFLQSQAEGNIFIMDESHNASGSSQVGFFLQGVLRETKGVVFLSATFAKRPDNMPLYAMKTAIKDANMTREELVDAITQGGVALQEILSSQLVKEGQMLRRERSFEGVEVNYNIMESQETIHRAIADNITEILRDIIDFQKQYVEKAVDELDDIATAHGEGVRQRGGTSQAGVDNMPYFSKIFNVINQMLFSIKAEAVADKAIARLKEGKKPVIAFSSTMGSFIEQMENEQGLPVADGDVISADFSLVLQRGLDGVLRYTVTGDKGEKEFKKFDPVELGVDANTEYLRIAKKIKSLTSGISISPIDIIVQKLKNSGYRVAEVTGRKYEVQLNTKTNKGVVLGRTRINTNDAFRQFNDNEIDVLLINQSGSTGASAHAIVTKKVPATEVKQRVMIVLQPELDINTEVQKRGRINRTGQILQPIYDYEMSAIPAEKRLLMMLQKKLKSLDANTASNQKQSTKILDVPDFLNKFGDRVVTQYLMDNMDVNKILGDPLKLGETENEDGEVLEDAALKVSGRVAVLSTKMQDNFYDEIAQAYNEYIEYLKQIGEYDLEVEAMNLQAETISSSVARMGKGGDSEFGTDSVIEKVMVNVLKKPFKRTELENLIKESLGEKEAKEIQVQIMSEYKTYAEQQLEQELEKMEKNYAEEIANIPNEKKAIAAREKSQKDYQDYLANREKILNEAKEKERSNKIQVAGNRKQYIQSVFKFFWIGRNVLYPIGTFNEGDIKVKAVFLGFVIDPRKKNPYAPSKIKMRFALANSNKYIAIPGSYQKEINAIMGISFDVKTGSLENTLSDWEEAIKEYEVSRSVRYIITGNLLQAFSAYKGKLVSYTSMSGEVLKGILLPEHYEPKSEMEEKITVPVGRAMPLFSSLVKGNSLITENGTSVANTGSGYKIIVPASKQRGGDVYLDADILQLVTRNNFEKTADKMVAYLDYDKLPEFLSYLQSKFNDSLKVLPRQFQLIKNEKGETGQRAKIILMTPQEVEKEQAIEIELALAEAELELDLELLRLRQAA